MSLMISALRLPRKRAALQSDEKYPAAVLK
jgi:hypothetical protein